MMTSRTAPKLKALAQLPDAAARGRALERYVAELFRARHFTVTVNARTARPRQTDLLAVKVAERYLVECKWQTRPATIHDLDSLRSRLRRVSPDVIGLLVSMAGFTDEVAVDVRYQRHQPVLLLSGPELGDIEAGLRHSLPDLLFRKRESLLRDAEVLLDAPRGSRRRVVRLPYPQPSRRYVSTDGTESYVFCAGGDFGRLTFTNEIADIDWSSVGGSGVALDVPLEIADQTELIDAINTLVDLGWTTGNGSWSIQQRSSNWHGFGIKTLLDELPHWRRRTGHHSEELVYVDECDNGFYTLSANLAAHPDRTASIVEVSFQLEGQPLDSSPFLHLCRSLGVHENLHIRPRNGPSRQIEHLDKPITDLVVRGLIIADDAHDPESRGPWATGIIADNPYFDASGRRDPRLPESVQLLARSEVLMCSLRQHHSLDQAPSKYHLVKLEWAWASDTLVCRPVADWPYPG